MLVATHVYFPPAAVCAATTVSVLPSGLTLNIIVVVTIIIVTIIVVSINHQINLL